MPSDRVGVPFAFAEAGAELRFEGLRRFARDEVDRAAHAARAVEHRDVALLHLDLGEVLRQEAIEVEAIVGRQIDANAVDRQRHLPAAEAAHVDAALVAARRAVERARDAGDQLDGFVERVAIERPDVLDRDRVVGRVGVVRLRR